MSTQTVIQKWPGPLKIEIKTDYLGLNIEVFHLIRSYIDLIEPLTVTPAKGLLELHEYRSGILDLQGYMFDKTAENPFQSREFSKKIVLFANSCICYNIVTFINILAAAIEYDLKGSNDPRNNFLHKDVLHQMHRFQKYDRVRNNLPRNELINSFAHMCYTNAHIQGNGLPSADTCLMFFETVRRKMSSFEQRDFKTEFLPLLKIFFYIACTFYKVQPGELLALRTQPLFSEAIRITDTTLSAIPMSPVMLNNCADRDTPSSTEAIIYMYNLEQALKALTLVERPLEFIRPIQ